MYFADWRPLTDPSFRHFVLGSSFTTVGSEATYPPVSADQPLTDILAGRGEVAVTIS